MLNEVTPPRAYVVRIDLVHEMSRRCIAQTSTSLSDQFGISWNTWSKLRRGEPIRRSVALRLVKRVLAQQGQDADPLHYLSDSQAEGI
ncbi:MULTISPECIES: hypothetical protein [unclassified Novosphingobium]|uniref:hypothetical protein n=1 Tax=unclassified Novosphingobium TaxID=2644732 RepID=UPI00061C20D1|nr:MULTISPECIES: hypothetical protein [unclassified Novosphingobium]GAO56594.1 hypothetical protein NMD1_03761 [Novosphingobium sp. MD-1]